MPEFGQDSVSLHFPPASPGQEAEPGNTVADLKRIFGAAPAVKTKLVVRKHDFSSAQTAYQRARSAPSSQLIFYKDATPRGEHYIRCSVACEPARPDVVPLRLALCYEDGTDVSPQDASCLKILGEATHLSCPPHAKETTFYYRLELSSFRRADRKYSVRISSGISAADGAEAGVIPCLAPPVLVLSKTKPLDASAPLSPPSELPDGLRRGQRPAGRKRTRPCGKPFSTVTPPTLVDFHTGARPAVGPFDPAAVAERRAIHEQILAINRRLENLKGSLSDLTVRLGAHSAAVSLPPTESA